MYLGASHKRNAESYTSYSQQLVKEKMEGKKKERCYVYWCKHTYINTDK